jgi:hypothetical protein
MSRGIVSLWPAPVQQFTVHSLPRLFSGLGVPFALPITEPVAELDLACSLDGRADGGGVRITFVLTGDDRVSVIFSGRSLEMAAPKSSKISAGAVPNRGEPICGVYELPFAGMANVGVVAGLRE